MSQSNKQILIVVSAMALALALGLYAAVLRPPAAPEVPFSEFLQRVERGAVAGVALGERRIEASAKDGAQWLTTPPPGYVAGNPSFVSDLARRGVRIEVRPQSGFEGVATIVGVLLLAGVLGLVAYRLNTGRVPLSGGRPKAARPGAAPVTFADVAGVDEAKDEVKEIVDFLRDPTRYAAVGGRVPTGVLLVGPPGTGKTLLARSIAGEAGVPFLFASGADFVEMYAGVGAARVRRLFKEARRHPSCIIFIDELDCVGRRRGGNSLSNEEREQTLNQLLVEMDGFEGRAGVVVIAATNRQDILDPALLRPGRFDRQVTVGCPDVKGREDILRVHARKLALEPGMELRDIARGTPGFSGAELANLMNEAALLCARAGRDKINAMDIDAARDKVLMGVERRSLAMTQAERVGLAYHEAGHAVLAALLPHADPLHKVSIVPRGRALGITMQLPEADQHTYSRVYLETQVAILMGGRVAEELFLHQATSGASNDIERATDIAERMVCDFGMSPLGPISFRRAGAEGEGERRAALSEETARRVDEEVRAVVLAGQATARDQLLRHAEAVRRLAGTLLERESLDADEVRDVIEQAAATTSAAA